MTQSARRKPGWWRLLVALFAFSLVAAACSSDDDDDAATGDTSSTTEAPDGDGDGDGEGDGDADLPEAGANVDGVVKLGAVVPLTGGLADFGPGILAGIEFGVAHFNENAGGLFGSEVELIVEDSGSDPDIANQAVIKLVNQGVDAIIGPAGTDATLQGLIPVVQQATFVACTGSATSPALNPDNVDTSGRFIRTVAADDLQGVATVQFLSDEGIGSLAVVSQSDAYGEALANAVATGFADSGGEVVAEISYTKDDVDASTVVGEILDANPEAVYVAGFPDDTAAIYAEALAQGIDPAEVLMLGGDGTKSDELPGKVNPDDPSAINGVIAFAPVGSPDGVDDYPEQLAEFDPDVSEITFSSNFFDCVQTILLAMHVADTDDSEVVKGLWREVTAGGEPCRTASDCIELIDGGTEDVDLIGMTGFDLSEEGQVSSGVYGRFVFEDGELVEAETIPVG